MQISVKINETGHPDVEPWSATVWVNGVRAGTGSIENCQKFAAELAASPEKAFVVYKIFAVAEREV